MISLICFEMKCTELSITQTMRSHLNSFASEFTSKEGTD